MSAETAEPVPPVQGDDKRETMDGRGTRRPSPLGTATFVGLRLLDIPLQHAILARGLGSPLLAKLGLSILPAGLPPHTGTLLDTLNLSPYRLILLSMATGIALKQTQHRLFVAAEALPPVPAAFVSTSQTLLDALNNLLFTTTLFSASLASGQAFPQWPLIAGSLAYVAGMALDVTSEAQRRRFDLDPANVGKPCSTGLWAYARHVDHASYCLYRAGYATAAAGFGVGALVFVGLMADSRFRTVPVLEKHGSGKYGAQWAEYERRTPYLLVPGVL